MQTAKETLFWSFCNGPLAVSSAVCCGNSCRTKNAANSQRVRGLMFNVFQLASGKGRCQQLTTAKTTEAIQQLQLQCYVWIIFIHTKANFLFLETVIKSADGMWPPRSWGIQSSHTCNLNSECDQLHGEVIRSGHTRDPLTLKAQQCKQLCSNSN